MTHGHHPLPRPRPQRRQWPRRCRRRRAKMSPTPPTTTIMTTATMRASDDPQLRRRRGRGGSDGGDDDCRRFAGATAHTHRARARRSLSTACGTSGSVTWAEAPSPSDLRRRSTTRSVARRRFEHSIKHSIECSHRTFDRVLLSIVRSSDPIEHSIECSIEHSIECSPSNIRSNRFRTSGRSESTMLGRAPFF